MGFILLSDTTCIHSVMYLSPECKDAKTTGLSAPEGYKIIAGVS